MFFSQTLCELRLGLDTPPDRFLRIKSSTRRRYSRSQNPAPPLLRYVILR